MDPDKNPKSPPFGERWQYYLVLWVATLGLFLILYFAKRVDDLLLGLSIWELCSNLAIPLALNWLLCALLAILSVKLENLGLGKFNHFVILFLFCTINLWSLKSGFVHKFAQLNPLENSRVAWVAYSVVMAFCFCVVWKNSTTWAWVNSNRKAFLKASGLSTVVLAATIFVPGQSSPRSVDSTLPNVILVSFDALSSKNLDFMGYDRATTPTMSKLAESSLIFENLRASFNFTPLSLRAMEGHLPQFDARGQMRATQGGLFDILQSKGWKNQAYFSIGSPQAIFGRKLTHEVTRSGKDTPIYKFMKLVVPERHLLWLAGLTSEEIVQLWPYTAYYDDDIFWKTSHYPAEQSFQNALEYLKEHRNGAFVWIHLWEPHYPYWPDEIDLDRFAPTVISPPSFINRPYTPGQQTWVDQLRTRYDQYLVSVDRKFGNFLDELDKMGILEQSLLVVTSDHGESFEQGFIGHTTNNVNEGISRVPLLIHRPGQKESLRVETLASHLDIAPTILDILGIPASADLAGESLMKYVENPGVHTDRVKFTISQDAISGVGGDIAIFWKDFKLVYWSHDKNRIALYNLKTDPQAENNIAPQNPGLVQEIMKTAGL